MTINSKFKGLIAVVFLSSLSSFAAADAEKSAKENNGLAPEATAAEAKLSFRDIPPLKKAFIDTAPAVRDGAFPVGELGVDGGNKDKLVKLAHEIADGKHGNFDSILIAHKGKLLFESYYLRGRINLAHPQASATKSYTSLILGRAMQIGYLTMADLDKPLVSFLKDLDQEKFADGAEKITLHQALTMSTGIRIGSDKWEELEKNPGPLKGQGLVQAILEASTPITAESQTFLYGTGPMLVMTVIDALVPGTATDFIKNELLDKLDITNYNWQTHYNGLPEAGWRVKMTSRDMLKLGALVLNKGKWNGEQLVPEAFVEKATSGITPATFDWLTETYFYGYYWYQKNITVGDKIYDTKLAWGGGGQRIIVVEELDLTIVITGHDGEDTIMTQISNVVVPAFVK